ncbi:glycosyltransferase [Cryobacterium sp.]|jgi:glycosyltransferase involved in cell wall biosynthesis|uniref:glycosyltransferase n=1 Tax=Cryobacterium sp. TaxID=1926290 RepID=UPI00262955C5|nr:glycosyltransferase [Cryobacterium sp.]MCU1446075.1 glycosyl transferase [Cryobacterium sp.]
MRILLWHVHGSWTDAFVQGGHDYLLPTTVPGDPWGLGRAGRDWPERAVDVPADHLHDADIDCIVLQRPREVELCEQLLGVRPGRDVPAVFVEHNTPRVDVPNSLHVLADRSDIPVVHVSYFNDLFWECGRAPTTVIEHGIVDPGALYTGELPRMAAVINEPVRRWRVTGTDLLSRFGTAGPVDLFGIPDRAPVDPLVSASGVQHRGDLPSGQLHAALARRRLYVHPARWTSLGLSLIEAMHLAMPVLVLATTEAVRAVPPEAGAISTNVDELVATARVLLADPDEARRRGLLARRAALTHYGLALFLRRWDEVLDDVTRRAHGRLPALDPGARAHKVSAADTAAAAGPKGSPR